MNSSQQNILVLDEQVDLADGLALELQLRVSDTVHINTVYSDKAAIEAASRREYDVVLTDLAMPQIDGFQGRRRSRRCR